MPKGHFQSAGASIDHGGASVLFPIGDLDASVIQHRDAELALANIDSEDVIVISPTSLASSYFLTQHALTAIPVDSLSTDVQTQLADEIDGSLDTFEFIQIGKWNSTSANHSLAEFTDA